MPEYILSDDNEQLIAGLPDEGLEFSFSIEDGKMTTTLEPKVYHKGRTWQTVTLTKDNWFDYYELKTTAKFVNDAFGVYEHVSISTCYVLKPEYAARLDAALNSTVDVKYGSYASYRDYTIDVSAQRVTLSDITQSSYTEAVRSAASRFVKELELNSSYLDGISGSAYFYADTQLVDAQGTIYLIQS